MVNKNTQKNEADDATKPPSESNIKSEPSTSSVCHIKGGTIEEFTKVRKLIAIFSYFEYYQRIIPPIFVCLGLE